MKYQNDINLSCPDFKSDRLKYLCETKWVEKHNAINKFCTLFPAVYCSLNEILTSNNINNDPIANGLITKINKSEFFVSSSILRRIFGISLTATLKLQYK